MTRQVADVPRPPRFPPIPALQRAAGEDCWLASLFDVEGLTGTPNVWITTDLAEVLRHQMDRMLTVELGGVDNWGQSNVSAGPDSPMTFGDLFSRPAAFGVAPASQGLREDLPAWRPAHDCPRRLRRRSIT